MRYPLEGELGMMISGDFRDSYFSGEVGSGWKQVNGLAGKRQNRPQDEPSGPVGLS